MVQTLALRDNRDHPSGTVIPRSGVGTLAVVRRRLLAALALAGSLGHRVSTFHRGTGTPEVPVPNPCSSQSIGGQPLPKHASLE